MTTGDMKSLYSSKAIANRYRRASGAFDFGGAEQILEGSFWMEDVIEPD